MILYVDRVFLLNALADGLALYVTACLAGLHVKRRKLVLAAVLGGLYGVIALLPLFSGRGGLFFQIGIGVALVYLTFGGGACFLRRFLLFFLLSCGLGGAFIALVQIMEQQGMGDLDKKLDGGIFLLVTALCYGLLSLIFQNGARHAVAGQLYRGRITLDGRQVRFTALLDTGHTLTDPFTGQQVLTVWWKTLEELWSQEERRILEDLKCESPIQCLERLSVTSPGRFRALPYRTVGVDHGVLLCFRVDGAEIDGKALGPVSVALAPEPVSVGEGFTALWGGTQI